MPGHLAAHGKRLVKLLPCAKYWNFQCALEQCHIMHFYNASLGKLSTFLPVYPGVEQLRLIFGGTQLYVE